MKDRLQLTLKSMLLFAAMFLFLFGCSGSSTTINAQNQHGSIAAKVTWDNQSSKGVANKAAAPADVITVRITVSGSGMDTIVKNFNAADGRGTIDEVPAGSNRTVIFQGLDSNGFVIYHGEAGNITITAGETTEVWIVAVKLPSPEEPNAAPVANAGQDQEVVTGSTVTLDGSKSSDADGDSLSYQWTMTEKPAGSAATLSGSSVAKPTFSPDVAGEYKFELVVSDSKLSSNTAAVTVTAADPVTEVGGIIDVDTTWTKANSPYKLTSTVHVAYGITLTIEPGVKIEGSDNYLEVLGTLNAVGSQDKIIIFNNINIQPYYRLDLYPKPTVVVQFAHLNDCNLFSSPSQSGSLTLRDSIVQVTQGVAYAYINLFNPSGDCYIERNIFIALNKYEYLWTHIKVSNNYNANIFIHNNLFVNFQDYYPISIDISNPVEEFVSVKYNSFVSSKKAISATSSFAQPLEVIHILASENYWGTTDTSVIDSMIYDYNDDLNAGNYVDYLPILTEPHPYTPDATPYL